MGHPLNRKGFTLRVAPNVKRVIIAVLLALATIAAILVYREFDSCQLQSLYFAGKAKDLKFHLGKGPSKKIAFPENGPYDQRLGYSLIPGIIERVTKRGYSIVAQARLSPLHYSLVKKGAIYPIYKEKAQAGLTILDSSGKPLFSALYPQLIYENFESIPQSIVQTLLVIENRDLLDPRYPWKNPTLEWSRLLRAVFDNIIARFIPSHESPGGSTLATQIEKYRHSPEGRTASPREKLIQMVSATLRAYQDGRNTMGARQRVVTDYINSVPLGAIPGAGEIRGIGHGLVAWHGASFSQVNELLADINSPVADPALLKAKALAYKEVMSLFLAQRRPAYYLVQNRDDLKELTDHHLALMVKAGVITPAFKDAVDQAELSFRSGNIIFQPERLNFVERKAANAVRVHLLNYFGFDRLYTLDRLDLKVTSTIDYETQKDVQATLTKLKDPAFAKANGLMDHRLLAKGNPAEVIYSVTLREKVGDTNLLRVQADNVDGPFNVSEGGKLELGSTAKLRTTITYLEIIEELWQRLRELSPEALDQEAAKAAASDHLTGWACQWLRGKALDDRMLRPMLEAALDRNYSGNPNEAFITGGGIHRFSNFDHTEDGPAYTVREAIRRSINLSFIRIIRDVAAYYSGQIPHQQEILTDFNSPYRQEYLTRFANKEGREFLGHFFLRYRGLTGEDVLEALLAHARKTPKHLAAILAVVKPEASLADYTQFLARVLPQHKLNDRVIAGLYKATHLDTLSLQDKGYIAGMHPLELWLVAYLYRQPKATYSQMLTASGAARLEAYQWLFNSREKLKQDRRIKIMLEQEAFQKIHAHWQKLGYPFATLVPTFATALGSSGDKPIALADLMSIIVGGGMQLTNTRVTEMDFAVRTPFETRFRAKIDPGQRVLSSEIAAAVHDAIREVVDSGTAVRVKGAFKAPDGTPLAVGGKTGTGDNRYSIFAPGGRVIESKAMSRTATFVFYIGERFFGTLTAYVPNGSAEDFNFTSALPVQILKILAPKLLPLINRQELATAHAVPLDLVPVGAAGQGGDIGEGDDAESANPFAVPEHGLLLAPPAASGTDQSK
ncbi:MAG: transglycosylase domain-containing protein [Proteobacteria bacterium]|nr:transglycosylase domain-containing protein [Pseudomonadota bacterium]